MDKKSNPQLSILVISMGFLVLFLLKEWRWAIWLSLIAGVMGIFSPWLTRKVDFLWMKLAAFLGWIMPNLILSIVFFVFLFPISLLSRAVGRKDNLQLRSKSGSTFLQADRTFNKRYFEKPW